MRFEVNNIKKKKCSVNFSAQLWSKEWRLPTHRTLIPSTTAPLCHWRTKIIFVVRYDTLPSGAKLFCAVMQMTAFIKGALLVIHCVPYHSFPKPQWCCGRHRGTSKAASATVKGILIRRGRVLGEWPAKSLQPRLQMPLCIVGFFVLILWSAFLSMVHGATPTNTSGKTHWK